MPQINIALNDWAKQELGDYCESLLSEHEETITELVLENKKDLAMRVCKQELKLCDNIEPKKANPRVPQ